MRLPKFFSDLEQLLLEQLNKPARILRLVFVLSFLPPYLTWVLRDEPSWSDTLTAPWAVFFGVAQLLNPLKKSWSNQLSLWSGCGLLISVIISTGGENSPFLFLFLLPILSYSSERNHRSAYQAFLINGSFYLFLIALAWKKGDFFAVSYLTSILIAAYTLVKTLNYNLDFLEWQIRILRKQAFRDPLTGLLNRAALRQIAPELLDRKMGLTLFLADLDEFKNYNDRKGHLAGDRLLREVARVLQESFRSRDLIFRYGGDEFLILVPEENPLLVKEFIERLRKNLHLALKDEIGISCGFSLFPQEAKTLKELLKIADQRLYSEKVQRAQKRRSSTEERVGKE